MIQLYLIDLKRGVEVRPFEPLENVRIVTETPEAILCLEAIIKEMDDRYIKLKKISKTEIDSRRDKLDRIVVAVDEASVLYTIERSSPDSKAQGQRARDLTDRIAKLGRAAGIHLILATQKVVKETIDPRTQTNINARICFRVNTGPSSQLVLGNNLAAELPVVPGRGIWHLGSEDFTVQVPKLSNDDAESYVDVLTNKFNGEQSPLKQKMVFTVEQVNPVADEYGGDGTGKAK